MTFIRLDYFPYIAGAFIVFCFFYLRQNITFYKWVKAHWFYKQSLWSRLATAIYLLAIALLLISLLDLRGKEHKIKSNVPNQKTIILIDSSSSMLVEDVRPNRFQKALLLARHYIKQAAGQQISIILFSDYQKTYVPFTGDIDLLDARIAGLSTLNITKGGSNLSQAIQESIQYFKENAGETKDFAGNILIFSDAEETITGFDLNIPNGISVAIVGVGTARGGPIPLRDSRNVFYGNKQFDGQEVSSKIDEGFLKLLGTKIKNYKYWIATSFALPTDEIVKFFTQIHHKRFSQGDVKIRPVKVEWVLIPGLVLFALAMFFKLQKSFVLALAFFILMSTPLSYAQDNEEAEPPPLDEKQKALVSKIADGEASKEEKLILAESFLKTKKLESAITLYEETLNNNPNSEHLKSYMNLGTALLMTEEIARGLKIYSNLADRLKQNPTDENQQLLKAMRANTLLAFKNQEDQKNQKQNKQDKQNQDKNNQDKNNKDKQSNSEKNDENSNSKDKEKGKQDKRDKEKKDQENDKNKNGEKKDKEEKKNEKGDEEDQENQDPPEAPKPEKKLKVKLPAQLKQLMSDDRALQEQILDTSTHETGKSRKAKDW